MKLVHYEDSAGRGTWGVEENGETRPLGSDAGYEGSFLASLLQWPDPVRALRVAAEGAEVEPSARALAGRLLAPIDRQEVWAAGVTYLRSKVARMEESEGAARFYDMVYDADRPELFLKATPGRVVGPEDEVRIRQDARWNVPEPEIGLLISPRLRIVGYTIGNDMSSRDIEGENPLYLPQAKVYAQSCALGPAILLESEPRDHRELEITLTIERGGTTVFSGSTSTGQMKRRVAELVDWLGRDNTFPHGVFLLTGTGLVPGDDFTLQPEDLISITVPEIGTLRNRVVQGSAA